MRRQLFLFLTLEFVVAVILPNEIGTHELPAVKGNVVVRAGQHKVEPLANGAFDAWLRAIEISGVTPTGRCQTIVSQLRPIVPDQQVGMPLLI